MNEIIDDTLLRVLHKVVDKKGTYMRRRLVMAEQKQQHSK
jgi:hypothetical protein